jgi:hypothetical protein
MSKKLFVFSTLAADVAYTNHEAGGADLPIALPSVLIKGGAGVANDRIVTPRGIATPVTEQELAYLRENAVFNLHEANGFILVSEAAGDADIVAADMVGRDHSAPIVPQDNIQGEAVTVVGGETVDTGPSQPRGRRHK